MRVSVQGQDDSGKGPAASDRLCGLDMVRSFVSLTQTLPGPRDSLDCRVCLPQSVFNPSRCVVLFIFLFFSFLCLFLQIRALKKTCIES